MDNEIEKPESALGFIPSHMKVPDDTDYVKNKFKNLQKAEENRIKLQEAEYAKKTAREEKEKTITNRDMLEDDPEADKRQLEEDLEAGFDPTELQDEIDGWEFYKRSKIPHALVKRYCQTLDQDYMKHKITICAHINHIFDLYLNQRRPFMKTLADQMIDK